jgi:hypothetical protein
MRQEGIGSVLFGFVRNRVVRNKTQKTGIITSRLNPNNFKIPEAQPISFHQEFVFNPLDRVNLLLPHMLKEGLFGGIATALVFIAKFKRSFPHVPIRILLCDGAGELIDARNTISKYLGTEVGSAFDADVVPLYDRSSHSLPIHRKDHFIATAWWTAFSAQKLSEVTGRPFIYFIQDFEPCFYPWGEKFAGARASYNLNFLPIFNSSFLKDYFIQTNILSAEKVNRLSFFEPAVDKRLFQHPAAAPKAKGQKRVFFFYGRKSVDRNLFGAGVIALSEAVKKGYLDPDQWEFWSAGEWHPDVELANGVYLKSKGKMTLEEYAQFLSTVDLGLSLMLSPHPSYPPLEMAALGVWCVTNRYDNKDLSVYFDSVISVEADIQDITQGLKTGADKVNQGLKSPAPQHNEKLFFDWNESLTKAVEFLHSTLNH